MRADGQMRMIGQVLPDTGAVRDHVDAQPLQLRRRTDASAQHTHAI